MSSVRLENINKSFGNINALSNLNLLIKDGEFLVLLGPTGAGKTTTLRIISGLEMPDSGNIFFNEDQVNNVQPAYRDTSYVFNNILYILTTQYTII